MKSNQLSLNGHFISWRIEPRSRRRPSTDPGWINVIAQSKASASLLEQEGTERQPLCIPKGAYANNNTIFGEWFERSPRSTPKIPSYMQQKSMCLFSNQKLLCKQIKKLMSNGFFRLFIVKTPMKYINFKGSLVLQSEFCKN